MSDSMKSAFLKTEDGKTFVVSAKKQKISEKLRLKQLRSLVHDTFMVFVPKGKAKRWDVYKNAETTIKSLAKEGGKKYDNAMFLVKHAHSTYDSKRRIYSIHIQRRNYKEAITVLGC